MANWWENETSVQSMLQGAFKSALSDYGVARSGENTESSKVDPSSVEDKSKNIPDTTTSITPPGSTTEISGKTSTQIEQEISAFTTAMKLPAKAVEIYDGAINALSKTVNPVLSQYNEIQEAYGGLNIDLDKAVGSSKAVIERLQSMQSYYYDVGNAGVEMSKKLGFSENIVSKYFKDEAEAFNLSEAVLGSLVDQHSQYINKLDEETLTKLPFYSKALGITSRDVAESVERSINSTGKAQTTMLDDIAMFAQGLEKSTGVPLKAIAQNAVQISNDTQRLGDVTAEEATRIAATLGQLGQTYDSFTGVLDKFQEFGSSAETSGLISQITGGAVNLDAQQLMYLASEEQEKFLPELRRSLLGGGFTKDVFEGMANAEQKQFAAALSMDREQVRSLLDTSREFNEADLIDDQAKIAAEKKDGFKVVTEQMELAPKYADKAAKSMDYLRTKAIVPLQQDLLLAAEEYSKLNAEIRDNVDVPGADTIAEEFRGAVQAQGKAAAALSGQLSEPVEMTPTDMGEMFASSAAGVYNKQNPGQQIIPVPPTTQAPPMSQEPPVNSNSFNGISAGYYNTPQIIQAQPESPTETDKRVITKLEEVQTSNIENAANVNTNNEATNQTIQNLTAAFETFNTNTSSQKELILKIDRAELGRILIDGKYIINGAPESIVKTQQG